MAVAGFVVGRQASPLPKSRGFTQQATPQAIRCGAHAQALSPDASVCQAPLFQSPMQSRPALQQDYFRLSSSTAQGYWTTQGHRIPRQRSASPEPTRSTGHVQKVISNRNRISKEEISDLEVKLAAQEAEVEQLEASFAKDTRQIADLELDEQRLNLHLERTEDALSSTEIRTEMWERHTYRVTVAQDFARDIKALSTKGDFLEHQKDVLRQDLVKAKQTQEQKIANVQLELQQELERQTQQLAQYRSRLDRDREAREVFWNSHAQRESALLKNIEKAEASKARFALEIASHQAWMKDEEQRWFSERQFVESETEVAKCQQSEVVTGNELLAQYRDRCFRQADNERSVATEEAIEAQRALSHAQRMQQTVELEVSGVSEQVERNSHLSLAAEDLQSANAAKCLELLASMQESQTLLQNYYGPWDHPSQGRMGQLQIELQSQQEFMRQAIPGADIQMQTAKDVIETALNELQEQQDLLSKQMMSARGHIQRTRVWSPPDPQETQSVQLELLRHTKECIQQLQVEILQSKVKAAGSKAEANAIQAEMYDARRMRESPLQIQGDSRLHEPVGLQSENAERLARELKILKHQLDVMVEERRNSQKDLQAALEELSVHRIGALAL